MATDKFRDFKFTGPKLDDPDLPRIGGLIGVGEDIVHGVMDTEAGGVSTDKNGRMKALYEPHVAYRNSKGVVREKLVKAGLAYPKWKRNYPGDSYPRIKKAMAIDETVALLATSWAFPQVLGENFALAGYESVQDMVLDFLKDEDNQLAGMINFIKNANLDDELRVLEGKLRRGETIKPDDARPFVRGYNGFGYAKNNYHTIFARNLNKWAKIEDTKWTAAEEPAVERIALSDDIYDGSVRQVVKSVQEQLDRLGYPEVGAVDGKWGTKTRAAVLAFRADNKLPITPTIDEALLAALMVAAPRAVADERKNATVADLREEGAVDVKAADTTQIAGGVAAAGGAVGALGTLADQFENYGGVVERVANAVAPVQTFVQDNFWLLLLGVGGVVVWQSGVLKNIRLRKHQTGNDVSV